jgi:hypothetical protein
MGKFVWAQADDINVIFTQKHVLAAARLPLPCACLPPCFVQILTVQLARRAHLQYLVKRNAEGSRNYTEAYGRRTEAVRKRTEALVRVGIYKCGPRGDR